MYAAHHPVAWKIFLFLVMVPFGLGALLLASLLVLLAYVTIRGGPGIVQNKPYWATQAGRYVARNLAIGMYAFFGSCALAVLGVCILHAAIPE